MKNYIFAIISLVIFSSCQKDEIIESTVYDCTPSFAVNNEAHPKHKELLQKIETYIEKMPGAQIAITSADGAKWTSAVGWADIPSQIPFEVCTETMIGSVSKVVTGAMILQLQDEGILSIEDPLSKWLDMSLIKEIENADKVNLKQLLNHTTGIKDYLAAKHFVNSMNKSYNLETQEEKLKYVYGKSAEFEPGLRYSYSNTNYVLLGLVIEQARNLPLWEVVDQFIATPLGLQNFEMGTHDNPIPDRAARPYLAVSGDKYNDVIQHAVADAATGDGGISTNMQDLNAFFEGLFNGSLLSSEALTQMTEEVVSVGDGFSYANPGFGEEKYGLGIERYDTPDGFAYGHQGSTSSYEAYSLYYPETGIAISIGFNGLAVQNVNWDDRGGLVWSLLDILLD